MTSDRFAVRRPGKFTGPDWGDENFIVATKHNLCEFSVDAITGEKLRRRDFRFWTLM